MKYLIATSGITHSGKTTFGESLKYKAPNLPIIDSDLIYTSLKSLILKIVAVEKGRTNITPENPRIRHIFLQDT